MGVGNRSSNNAAQHRTQPPQESAPDISEAASKGEPLLGCTRGLRGASAAASPPPPPMSAPPPAKASAISASGRLCRGVCAAPRGACSSK